MKKYLLLISMLLVAMPGHTQTVADIADGLIPQLKNVIPIVYIISYLAGIVFGIKGALKLKESNESKGQVKLSSAIIYFIAAALFLGLPTFVNTGIEFVGLDTANQFKY